MIFMTTIILAFPPWQERPEMFAFYYANESTHTVGKRSYAEVSRLINSISLGTDSTQCLPFTEYIGRLPPLTRTVSLYLITAFNRVFFFLVLFFLYYFSVSSTACLLVACRSPHCTVTVDVVCHANEWAAGINRYGGGRYNLHRDYCLSLIHI